MPKYLQLKQIKQDLQTADGTMHKSESVPNLIKRGETSLFSQFEPS